MYVESRANVQRFFESLLPVFPSEPCGRGVALF
jgi:hypothetical protein